MSKPLPAPGYEANADPTSNALLPMYNEMAELRIKPMDKPARRPEEEEEEMSEDRDTLFLTRHYQPDSPGYCQHKHDSIQHLRR